MSNVPLLVPMAGGSGEIKIGEHTTRTFLGMTWNIDTIISTVIAAAVVLVLAYVARRALTRTTKDHVPTKVQLLWETIVKQVNSEVESNLGRLQPFVVPLAITLFFFILICNWLELLPTEINEKLHLTPAPTADTNLTYAMALLVIVSTWVYGIREQGLKGWLKHFLQPYPVLLPLNVLEELIKPVTLALRLFGNIFAGGIMLTLIGLIPVYVLWAPNLIWKLFDMFIGGIQAFIFALLTVLYFAMAGQGHGSEEHDADHAKPDGTPVPPSDHQPDDEHDSESEKSPQPAAA